VALQKAEPSATGLDLAFQATLKNLLSKKPKPQSEMKVGKKRKGTSKKQPKLESRVLSRRKIRV
jgi:hypothetical protein